MYAVMIMAEITIFVALFAGLLSFLSPCILPIIPGFIAYLSGTSADGKISRKESFLNSLFFVLGFSLIFALLGVLLNTALSGSSLTIKTWLGRIGGLIIIFFGLHVLGLLKIPFLQSEHKLAVKTTFKNTYITSFIFGASFAVGWSPCVGAILGSVFALAVSNPGIAFVLLMAYAIGLGLPFLLVGLFTEKALKLINKSQTFLKYFNSIVGTLLVILGILVFTDNLLLVSLLLTPQFFFN